MNTQMTMTIDEIITNIMEKSVIPKFANLVKYVKEDNSLLEKMNCTIVTYDYIFEVLPYICFIKDSSNYPEYDKMFNDVMIKIPELMLKLHNIDTCPVKKMECMQSFIRVQMFANALYFRDKHEEIKHSSLAHYFAVQTSVNNKFSEMRM